MRTITFLIGLLILGISSCPVKAQKDPGVQVHFENHQLPKCLDATRPEVVGLDPGGAVEGNFPPTIFGYVKTTAEFEATVHRSPLPLIPRLHIKIRVLRN